MSILDACMDKMGSLMDIFHSVQFMPDAGTIEALRGENLHSLLRECEHVIDQFKPVHVLSRKIRVRAKDLNNANNAFNDLVKENQKNW